MTKLGPFTAVWPLVTALAASAAVVGVSAEGDVASADYVGSKTCAQCHDEQDRLWRGSHHDLAMQPATASTVLGDFADAQITHFGVTSTFYKRDGHFMVRTDGPDGSLRDYEIAYTFGVDPLQQYLIAFPGGRYQALGIAWDTRTAEEGGQRWFHLYPDEPIPHDDELHWTGLNQNWNHMCAECHSTNLRKNFAEGTGTFKTTWSEINVACEACHGPGSQHVTWAQQHADDAKKESGKGLVVALNERAGIRWEMNPVSGNARRSDSRRSSQEIEMCARCHSRRSTLTDAYIHGKPLLDTHHLQLLRAGMYYVDGQIQDEVYVYGSFVQSKMYAAGVTCSDCHEPHSLKLRAEGSGVCSQCHLATKYGAPTHHFHPADSKGGECVECHMPATTYMVIDPRRDHSIRIPRPDLTVRFGLPNACNNCHADRSPEWAAEQVVQWYGRTPTGHQRYAENLNAARTGAPSAERLLSELAGDGSAPDIARATAMAELTPYLSRRSVAVIRHGLSEEDPLIRQAALRPLEAVAPEGRLQLAYPLLRDPVRAVRLEAARVLAAVPPDRLTTAQAATIEAGVQEYTAVQRANADRPEAHLNLGLLYAERGELSAAEAAYRRAIELQPAFVPAYVNLADLMRAQGRDEEGEKILREALITTPRAADVRYSLGLLLVRQKRMFEAVKELGEAARLAQENTRYAYVHAVALDSVGARAQALEVLERAHQRNQNDPQVLEALVAYHRKGGNMEIANQYAERLAALQAAR